MADSNNQVPNQTATAYQIPLADASGKIAHGWLTTGSSSSSVAVGNHTHPYGNQVCLDSFIEEPSRSGQQNFHGFFGKIVDAGVLNSGSPLTINNGIGKIVIVPLAGADFTGSMLVTGTSVNRNTGVETALDTDSITVDTLSTDTSSTDAEGNATWAFANAYITSKWFKGAVTLSTANVNFTDVDVYAVAFEQFGDNTSVTVNAFDITAYNTGVAEWLYAYLYKVQVAGSKVTISQITNLSLDPPPIAARSYRLRKGSLATTLTGTTDGIFINMFLGPAPVTDWVNISMKVWATLNSTTSVLA